MAIDDELEAQILRYHFVEHWRVGTIASQLGVHHSTVERVLGEAGVERERQRPRRPSKLDSYMAFITETLERFPTLRPALEEARAFLALPACAPPAAPPRTARRDDAPLRLWQMCTAIDDSHAEAYLHARAIRACREPALRFHPALYYRGPDGGLATFPALVARVSAPNRAFTAIQRTYLHPRHAAKAPVPDARKSLGRIHGYAVYFGAPAATLIVAEGIETALSLRTACPDLGAAATLGAAGLTAFTPPPGVARLLIARDDDPTGDDASERLCVRCRTRGVDARVFIPLRADFNDDLLDDGPAALAMRIAEALRR